MVKGLGGGSHQSEGRGEMHRHHKTPRGSSGPRELSRSGIAPENSANITDRVDGLDTGNRLLGYLQGAGGGGGKDSGPPFPVGTASNPGKGESPNVTAQRLAVLTPPEIFKDRFEGKANGEEPENVGPFGQKQAAEMV